MADLKTTPSDASVAAFLDAVTPQIRQADARQLNNLFQQVTGFQPQIWGGSSLGYGRYDYTYASGRSGCYLATGFSPRKAALSIYIMPGYADFSEILAGLGKYKLGKSCLYVTRLADIDTQVLGQLIRAGLADLATKWPVLPG